MCQQPKAEKKFIYMDNGATSWPKPQAVIAAVTRGLTEIGANPGRGAYDMALAASREIFAARQTICRFFNGPDSKKLIFTANTTEGLNYALQGCLEKGDHVLYSPIEHNGAWRPLMALGAKGIEVEMVEGDSYGVIRAKDVEAKIKTNTKMIVCAHAGNVTGTIQPLGEIGAVARSYGLLLLVDAAQSAGILPLDIQAMQIDLLAAPGHKGLYGPMGTGVLYVGERAENIRSLKQGGTGSHSHDSIQPVDFPDRLECGTLNLPGIAGLKAGVEWLEGQDISKVQAALAGKTQFLLEGLSGINGLKVYGPPVGVPRTTLVSVNLEGMSSNQLAFILDKQYNIGVRAGFHCSPLGHQIMGTTEAGAVRFSLGTITTRDELQYVINAMAEISDQGQQ